MSEQMRAPAVEVANLRKVYEPTPAWLRALIRTSDKKSVVALDDISFRVQKGQICAVVGPNGAGKSTLFRIITGLTSPTRGSAAVLGIDVSSCPTELRRVVGFMPADDRSLYMRQTCRENMWFHGRLQGMSPRRLPKLIDDTLELVGLTRARDRVAVALSSGMNARLRLARSLLHRPEVLILDEPTGTVDPVASHELLNAIQTATVERGMAVLLSSHRMEDIEALHDNVLLINEGRIAYWGDLDNLRARWEQPRLVVRTIDEESAMLICEALSSQPDIEVGKIDALEVTVAGSITMGELLSRLDGHTGSIEEVHRDRMPLRELLAEMVQDEAAGGAM